MLRVQARIESTIQCPYCHGDLDESRGVECPDCQTKSHEDCLDIHGQCPVFACHSREKIIIDLAQATREREAAAASRLRLSRWTLGFIGLIFAIGTSNSIPAFRSMYEETGLELDVLSQWTVSLFGSWDGWSSVLVTLLILALNRILARLFPNYRAEINTGFSFILLVILPILIAILLFLPLTNSMHGL